MSDLTYSVPMVAFIRTQAYDNWLKSLGGNVQGRIVARVSKFETSGHPMEMRLDFGPGYRVYYMVLKQTVILLGGDKSTQAKDIKTAKDYAKYWKGQKL